jgi:nitroimidazol reductase NimA-like FMN-containing flavoprotein (pyridoxamine 5'-phosphate oxidase superfamily)
MLDDRDHQSPPVLDHNGLELIPHDECLRLLAASPVARLGVTWDALPAVLPVNIAVTTLPSRSEPELVVRSVDGTKLHAALQRTVVAVEVDEIDPLSHLGWSVLVRGETRVLTDRDELEAAHQLPLEAWASVAADRFIAIGLALVSGRRITLDHGRVTPRR